MRLLVLLSILLAGPVRAADAPAFAPTGELGMVAVAEDGTETPVADGATVARGTSVLFVAEVQGASYLYLLLVPPQGDATVLLPMTGVAWMAREGPVRASPQPPSARAEDDHATTWNPESGGRLEFVLVAAPAPRDVPQDSRTPSLDAFLLPPAHVEGPQAGPAVVLDRLVVTFAE